MAFGTFTFTGHFEGLTGIPASGKVRIDGNPQVVTDTAGHKVRVGPRTVILDSAGNFSVTLPSDATTGNSTGIAYRVTTDLKGLSNIAPLNFYARPIGAAVDLADLVNVAIPEVAILPVGPQGATGPTGPQGPQGLPGVNAVANDTATAGYVAGPSSTKTALDTAYASLPKPGRHALTGMFHVDGYGADPTGSANSDTAWANVMTAVNVAGGTVYAPGTYKTTAEIVVAHDNVHILGDAMGVSRINYTGTGAAIRSDPAAIRRACGVDHMHISCLTAGGTALKLDNAYRWVCTKSKFESQSGTTGVAVDIVGSLTKSTYLNEFHACDAWGSQDCVRMGDNVNGIRWIGGNLEGPGRSVSMISTNANMGTNMFISTAIQSEGTNTAGVIIDIGTAGGAFQASYNSFVGCRIETAANTTIQFRSNAWYNSIVGGSLSGTVTVIDTTTPNNLNLMMVPSAAQNFHFPSSPDAPNGWYAGRGLTSETQYGPGRVRVTGAGPANFYLSAVGPAAVVTNGFSGDGTGGFQAWSGGASPAVRAQIGPSRGVDLTPALGNDSIRVTKSGETSLRLKVGEDGLFTWGDGAGVFDVTLSRKSAGVFNLGGVTTGTTAPAAGAAGALPATPAGYITISVNGTNRQIPYY